MRSTVTIIQVTILRTMTVSSIRVYFHPGIMEAWWLMQLLPGRDPTHPQEPTCVNHPMELNLPRHPPQIIFCTKISHHHGTKIQAFLAIPRTWRTVHHMIDLIQDLHDMAALRIPNRSYIPLILLCVMMFQMETLTPLATWICRMGCLPLAIWIRSKITAKVFLVQRWASIRPFRGIDGQWETWIHCKFQPYLIWSIPHVD